MLICLDCGNSRLKWGLHVGGLHPQTYSVALTSPWLAQGTLGLAEIPQLSSVLAKIFTTQLATELNHSPQPIRIIACNVANAQMRATITSSIRPLNTPHTPITWVTSQAKQCGVSNSYDEPSQLGSDRWAALIAAHHLHQGNAVVVNAGTATTVDLITANGIFQGGLILPGLDLMRQSLAHNTAQLPLTHGTFHALPRNTHDAIASGCLQATAGAIVRMYAQLDPTNNPACLLSGGAAHLIAPLLEIPLRHIDNLVLEGLAYIATLDP